MTRNDPNQERREPAEDVASPAAIAGLRVSPEPPPSPASRIWSEDLPYADLLAPAVLALIRRYRLRPLVAVRPGQLDDLARVGATLDDAGIEYGLWPMLDDDDGRWPNRHNATAFLAFVRRMFDRLAPAARPPIEIVFDLEPDLAWAKSLTALRPAALLGPRGAGPSPQPSNAKSRQGPATLVAAAEHCRDRGVAVTAAVLPMLAFDRAHHLGFERYLGTPVTDLGCARIDAMAYTSLFRGYSRGLLDRDDALALLVVTAAAHLNRFGPCAGLSLGAVGVGALGDEQTFADPDELLADASVARALGFTDLGLFDLRGVLARPPAEAWLDALIEGATGAPALGLDGVAAAVAVAPSWPRRPPDGNPTWPKTRKSAVLSRAARLASRALHHWPGGR